MQTVGALAAAIGLTLLAAGSRAALAPDAKLLSILSAVAFGVVDVLFVLNGTISPIYLADAAPQASFLLTGAAISAKRRPFA